MEKRSLGRGLEALISDKATREKAQIFDSKVQQGVSSIPIDKIKTNKYQPREDFKRESLEELANSIKEKGIIQPIILRQVEGEYELIAGERRLRAAKMLDLKEVPAIIKEASDVDSLELSIIENVQREDLNAIDQAKAYQRLVEEFDLTQDDVAEAVGKDRTTVTNIIRLLKLPKKIQDCVSHGTLSMGHARAILSLSNESEQMRLCTKVIKKGLSVRDTESYVRKFTSPAKKKIEIKDPNLESLEENLSQALGTKVKIFKCKKGGRIEIEFYSDSDLERVVTLLKSGS